jgi:hypothetical protein
VVLVVLIGVDLKHAKVVVHAELVNLLLGLVVEVVVMEVVGNKD